MYDKTRMSAPLPNWAAVFTLHPELEPPGYAKAVIYVVDNPRPKLKELEEEEKKKKKKKKKLGRNETS